MLLNRVNRFFQVTTSKLLEEKAKDFIHFLLAKITEMRDDNL